MKRQHDFSRGTRNPHASRLRRRITIGLDEETIQYFRDLDDAPVIQPAPQDMGNGTFWFQFRDPAGNIIEAIGPA